MTPYQSRHLTLAERRCIAHALRQLAEAARSAFNYDPLGAEILNEEARDHDRLAGLIERNGLRFTDPSEGETR